MTPPRHAPSWNTAGPRAPKRASITAALWDPALNAADDELAALTGSFPPAPLPGGPGGHTVLTFIAPDVPLSVNATAGRSFAVSHANKRAWHAAGWAAARAVADQLEPYRGHRVELTFCLPLRNWRQADGANYASGVSVKAAVDAIVATGLLVPDDRSAWVALDCVFWAGGPTKNEVRVRVRTAGAPWDGQG